MKITETIGIKTCNMSNLKRQGLGGLCLLLGIIFLTFSPLYSQVKVYPQTTDGEKLEVAVQVFSYPEESWLGTIEPGEAYLWDTLQNPKLSISALGYADTTISYLSVPLNSSIFVRFRPVTLPESFVYATPSWLSGVFIKGFEPWQHGWVFLGRDELYITDKNLDLLYERPYDWLELQKPHHIDADVFHRIFLLGKDSVVQLFPTDSALITYPKKSREKYDYFIAPLLAQTATGALIYRDVMPINIKHKALYRGSGLEDQFDIEHPPFHQCGARIIRQYERQKDTIITFLDTSAYEAARHYFYRYFYEVRRFWEISANKGYISLVQQRKMGKAKMEYSNIYRRFKKIYWLKFGKRPVILNPYNSNYVLLSADNKVASIHSFNLRKVPRRNFIQQDMATGKYYLVRTPEKFEYWLQQLSFEGQKLQRGQSIYVDTFCENVRVRKQRIFYLDENHKLRVKSLKP